MIIIHLDKFDYLSNSDALEKLNNHVRLHDTLMPHQVAVATGCRDIEAMEVLMFLHTRTVASAFLLVYHANGCDDEPPILARSIIEGPPSLPVVCKNCGSLIEDKNDLAYDFLFQLKDQVRFEK